MKYPAYDRELLALKESMLAWRFFTQGFHVTVHTDHRSLEQILKQRSLSSRQFGALLALSSFDYDIKYIRGAKNVVADRLSRRADHELDVSDGFMSVVEEVECQGRSVNWLDKVRDGYKDDEELGPIHAVLCGGDVNNEFSPAVLRRARVRAARFELVDGLVILKEGQRIAIPNKGSLRQDLCKEHHDTPFGGHFGRERTGMAIRKRYYWPRMSRMVASYVRGCDICHRVKPSNEKPFGQLEPLEIPEERWSRIGIDFITKLPKSQAGHDCIVSVVDHLTKRAHFLPAVESGLTSEHFAKTFCDFYVRLHGVPDMIVSDQDPRFMGDFWQALMKTLKVSLGMSSAYHPQTDGQTEKVNNVIGVYLRAFSRHNPNNWDSLLPLGEFAYNASLHASTGKTPFELDLGYTPRLPIDLTIRQALKSSQKNETAMTFAEQMKSNLEVAKEKLAEAQDQQKVAADQKRQESTFQIGQQVYLSTKYLPLTYSNSSDQRSRKLQDLYDGPFTITKASRSPNAWYLDLPPSWNVRQPLNVSLFKKDLSDPTRERKPPPVKNAIDAAEYLVDEIVDHTDRQSGRKVIRLYRLRWTGWAAENDTWEPLSNLEGCAELVERYHKEKGWQTPTWPRRSSGIQRK